MGEGRLVLRLPDPQQQRLQLQQPLGGAQVPGVLHKQVEPQATISRVLDVLVTSYSAMQVCKDMLGMIMRYAVMTCAVSTQIWWGGVVRVVE